MLPEEVSSFRESATPPQGNYYQHLIQPTIIQSIIQPSPNLMQSKSLASCSPVIIGVQRIKQRFKILTITNRCRKRPVQRVRAA